MTAGPSSRGRLPGWLSAGLFLAWGWLVWGRSGYLDRGWSPRMLDEMLAPSQYAVGLNLQTLILWAGYAARILLIGGIFLAARAVGRRALAFLRPPEDLAGPHRAVWEIALGLGVFCMLWFLLGLAGLYRPWVAWLVLAGGAGLAAWDFRHRVGAGLHPRPSIGGDRARSPLRAVCLLTLLASLALNALTILCPEGYYDTLVYHLGVPRSYLLHGRLGAVPFNAHQHTMGYWHMMYVWGLLLWDEVFCKVLHAGSGVLLVAAAVTGAGLLAPSSRGAGWVAGLLLGTAPVVCLSGWPAAAEMPTALFGALCGIAAVRCASCGRARAGGASPATAGLAPAQSWARLAGVAGGLALGTKYTGGLAVAASVAVLLASRAWRPAAIVAGLSVAVASPWFIKNALITGNPVFPYLGGVFGLGGYAQADVARFIAATTEAPVRSLWEGARHLWVLSVGEPGAAAGLFLGSAFLLLAPLPFFPISPSRGGGGGEGYRWLALYVAVGVVGWLAATRLARYGLPVLPLLAILLALAVDRAKGGLRALAIGGLLLASWFNLYEIAKITYYASQGMRVTLGLQTPESFLNSGHVAGYTAPSQAVMAWANAHLPREALVLCLGEPRGAYLQRRFIAPSVYDRQPLAAWVRDARDAAGIAVRLKQEGVTHLLVNEELLRREGVERVLPWTAPERARFDEFAAVHLALLYKEGVAVLYVVQ